jgi:dipeptidyl aminopeptidase/acylaminoacyl peptidase
LRIPNTAISPSRGAVVYTGSVKPRQSYPFLVLFLTCLTPPLAAQTLTPHDVANLRNVREVALSPDGQQIAYLLEVPRNPLQDENGPAWTELHLVRSTGESRPFVSGDVNVGFIRWRPDGNSVSFLAKRGKDEHRSLYSIPAAGGEARRLVAHGADITFYSWSPDGDRVAFLAAEAVDKKREEQRKKGFNAEIYEEELRPVKVWIANLAQDAAEPRALDLPGSASELHWSPNGDRLAVALAPTPLVDDHYMNRRVRLVDPETGSILLQIENPGKLGQVTWSPDGNRLAMISAADIHDPLEGRLMVASTSDGVLRDLLPGWEGHLRAFVWRDPQTIVYLADQGVTTGLEEIRADGSNRRVLLAPGPLCWSALSLSRDGERLALIADSPEHPFELFFFDQQAREARRLTDSNPWLENIRKAPQEVIEYSARDGLVLEGMLIRPLDEQPGQRYPLILVVHGGPEAHYRNGWLTGYSTPGQIAAAQGYAVFYPNYRGSTGRGVDFSKMGQGDPAGKEFDDLVDGVDHLINLGLVDRQKVGITGGSYGGYASAWGATYYSDRFAAAVMFVGISDKVAKLGTTDIPEEMFLVHELKWPWEDWAFMHQRSPLYYVERARTPILILTGKDDPRVHPSQSLMLYRYLKNLGRVPVRLVHYPGEGHGNRRAAARLDYTMRLMRWMDHYLKGPGGDPPGPDIEYQPPTS